MLGAIGPDLSDHRNECGGSEHGGEYWLSRIATIRINGLDIEPSARQRITFGMMCRTYEGSGGVPSEDLIRSAIAEAQR